MTKYRYGGGGDLTRSLLYLALRTVSTAYHRPSSRGKSDMEHLILSLRQGALARPLCSPCLRWAKKHPLPLRTGLQNAPRNYHASSSCRDNSVEQNQAQPLGGFYEDLLSTPIPQAAQKREEPNAEPSGPKIFYGAERKYRGGISDTPDSTWRTINGVPIPPRPAEPDNCCMSGCIHCVWDDYRDEVEGWAIRLREAQAKAQGTGMRESPKVGMHRPEVHAASASMDEDGGGSEGLWDTPSIPGTGEDLFEGIPVGIRHFMLTEKMLRDRKKRRNKYK